jgi:two-component system, sensor histidine kinase and response regulator
VPKQTLDVPRIEAAGLELEDIEFDLREMLEEVTRLIAIEAHAKGLEVIGNVDPAAPNLVKGDPARLRQILLSLGDNAVKFTHEGEVALRIRLIEAGRGSARILFKVRDTGIGIPATGLDALFRPLPHLDASTTGPGGGTKARLPIVKRLVELMAGQVGVDSCEGVGSTFWFTARFGINSWLDPMRPRPPKVLRGKRVLVVDDRATSLAALALQLRRCGIEAVCVESAQEALWSLEESARADRAFQIALLDHRMPGCDGVELGARINADAQLRETRLILLTSPGHGGADVHRLAVPGFSGYLLKPVAYRDLVDCLTLASTVPVPELGEHFAPMASGPTDTRTGAN